MNTGHLVMTNNAVVPNDSVDVIVEKNDNHYDCAIANNGDVLDLFCTDDDCSDYNIVEDQQCIENNKSDMCASTTESTDDDDTDDDEEDDGVNIIIENNSMSVNYDQYMNGVIQEDFELNVEIKKLINNNAQQRGYFDKPAITLYVQESTIPISVDTVISSRLADHVWGTENQYKQFVLKNQDCFDLMLQKYSHAMNNSNEFSDGDEYVAFFATIYENMQKNNGIMDYRNGSSSSTKNRFNNLHFFNKFAIIVLRHGKFVDAAVHGHYSSVTHVLKKYKPTRIYCAGNEHDTIDAFLKFKHQPFYGELATKIRYIGRVLIHNRTSVMFCPLNLRFCAFCRVIDTILTYYTNLQQNRFIPAVLSNAHQHEHRRKNRSNNGKTFRPALRQLVESLKTPRYTPYNVLNYRSRMNFIKRKRLSHHTRRSCHSTNSYVIGIQ